MSTELSQKDKNCQIVDVSITTNINIESKEGGKITKYSELNVEMARLLKEAGNRMGGMVSYKSQTWNILSARDTGCDLDR